MLDVAPEVIFFSTSDLCTFCFSRKWHFTSLLLAHLQLGSSKISNTY